MGSDVDYHQIKSKIQVNNNIKINKNSTVRMNEKKKSRTELLVLFCPQDALQRWKCESSFFEMYENRELFPEFESCAEFRTWVRRERQTYQISSSIHKAWRYWCWSCCCANVCVNVENDSYVTTSIPTHWHAYRVCWLAVCSWRITEHVNQFPFHNVI